MNILLIETATSVCSVALGIDGRIAASRASLEPNAHSTRLTLLIEQLLNQARLTPNQLDAVCVSAGPGSYTGLRIGTSTAKGLCYALDKPLLSVPTLLSMAALYYRQHPDYSGLVCPMIDARRMECYTIIAQCGKPVILRDTRADIITQGIYDQWLNDNIVTFIGDGAAKTRPILAIHPNARFDDSFTISAEGMAPLAEQLLRAGSVHDVAYFEPLYLKDFVAKKSVVHGLR